METKWFAIKTKAGRWRRSKPISKRLNPLHTEEDETVAHTARISSRTVDAANYAEIDDDNLARDFDATVIDETTPEDNDTITRIERVVNYCPTGDRKLLENGTFPFSNYHPNTVNMNIKWMQRPFQKNTCQILADLETFKGFKNVTNYTKRFEDRRHD